MPSRPITGQCLCGAVHYRAAGPVLTTAVCHCEDCQRATGSAFSVNVGVRASTLEVDGELATYETTGTDTGERRQRRFCPRCGSPVLTLLAETPDLVVLKGGTLDDRSRLSPQVEVWRSSAQPWIRHHRWRPKLRRSPPPALVGVTQTVARLWRSGPTSSA